MNRSGRGTKEAARRRPSVLYPGDVEDAMPEGNLARWLATYLLETILRVVAVLARDSAYANLPIYYVKGDPAKHVSPDVFFLRGVPYDPDLVSYRLWETRVAPRVVFEIVSRKNPWKDRVRNREIYESLRIPEYYWFEPRKGTLAGMRLDEGSGRYVPEPPGEGGRIRSPELGLEVGLEGRHLALYKGGVYLPPTEELLSHLEGELSAKDRELAEERRRREELEKRLRELEGRDK
ncbi:MAG: Uma2 family endonuclease [Planctomycetes bacterium]|nr:Uma2 family endonuclease [Planctomycetota bacterium]